MKGLQTFLTTALLTAAIVPPTLASDRDLAERIAACTREKDDARRLTCFDRAAAPQAAATKAATPQAAATKAATPQATATKADTTKVDATQTFGVQGSELARNREDSNAPEGPPKRISSTVAAIDKRPRGELVVTLDNGQVWAQKEPGAYFPLKVGDPVAILAGSLGSFRLIAGSRATAVTRVQ